MIYLARFHSGERIAINPDLIERIEETPDTVITLTSGAKYVVGETMDEVAERYRAFRASMFTLAISMVEPRETTISMVEPSGVEPRGTATSGVEPRGTATSGVAPRGTATSGVEPRGTVRGARLHLVRDAPGRPPAVDGIPEPESAES